MSTNRPFLANFLAAFRAQSTYKAATVTSQSTNTLPSAQSITQSARAIATKATTTTHSHSHSHHNHHHTSSPAATPHQYHHTTDPLTAPPPASSSSTSTPIPINHGSGTVTGPDRQRRGSDSSSGSGGFYDALGAEKWYIGGRTPAGEERFYRLGMVTNGGGRLGGGGRVGSIDQLSL
ncbi:hypothetical protein N7495_000245 [Penicillium taxi]|uniref:uncharacterized protein n=1 Tax=Penicillium taxi TaxID=168475 RepID=UPI002545115A|nr:uncharacterized protein N7495_000245 [Penicillium taxi]KAJ5907563.1 hypothetical protein N7495_000245 [Penicillium taxi]